MERAVVNGVELEYEITGTGDPVLFIHGSHIADSYVAMVAQPALHERFTLIRYHRRGYLGSAPPHGPVSMADQAADASALLAHLNLAAAHVVGHSFGGSIALQMAIDHPEGSLAGPLRGGPAVGSGRCRCHRSRRGRRSPLPGR